MNDRDLADKILRESGVLSPAAALAKSRIDDALDKAGEEISVGAPRALLPGASIARRGIQSILETIARNTRETTASPAGAASGAVFDYRGLPAKVQVLPTQTDDVLALGSASFEPSDLSAAVACTSLATSASGGTEIKFNKPGIIYVGSGAIGVFWARALGASINTKWAPLMAGMRLAYHPQAAIFFGTNTVGGALKVGGVLTLAFYELPPDFQKKKNAWKRWHQQIGEWTEGAGSDTATSAVLQSLSSGAANGTDVSLGTFSDAGAGTQIFKVGTNFPVGGASKAGAVILNASNANTDAIWVAETAALAVASNGGLYQAGQDVHNKAIGDKLFMLANSGTQVLSARYRS